MKKRLRIENFKCLRDVEITLGKFNVFIGENNTGKSSMMDAIKEQENGVNIYSEIPICPKKVIGDKEWKEIKRIIQPPAILLLKHPESGIHHKFLEPVVELLRAISSLPETMVVISTYSPYLLDFTTPEEVYIFHKDESGATKITPMSQVKGIYDWLSEYQLGELWYNWGEEELVRRATETK